MGASLPYAAVLDESYILGIIVPAKILRLTSVYSPLLSILALVLLISACGGGGGGSEPTDPPPVVVNPLLEITLDNYDPVVAYGYAVPESMLQIGQMVESYVGLFQQQNQSIITEQCQNDGQVQLQLTDTDSSGDLTVNDNLTIRFTDCFNDIINSGVRGDIELLITSLDANTMASQAVIDLDTYDDEGSILFASQRINIRFDSNNTEETLTVSNGDASTTLSFEGFVEALPVHSVTKRIIKADQEYRVEFNFAAESSILDGDFSCQSASPFRGYISSLPLDYQFSCTGQNTVNVLNAVGDEPNPYDTQVTVNFVGGGSETIFFIQEQYIEGTLFSGFSSVQADYLNSIIDTELDGVGAVSEMLVDENADVIYAMGMAFGEAYQGIVVKLNESDLSVISSFTTPNRIQRMHLSADGAKLYVIEQGSKSVTIYNTNDFNDTQFVNIPALLNTTFSKINHIDIVSSATNPEQWLYYIKISSESILMLFDGISLIDSHSTEITDSTYTGSLYRADGNRFISMEVGSFSPFPVVLNEYSISNDTITHVQRSDLNHDGDIYSLFNDEYFRIRFENEGYLYADNGLIFNANDFTLVADIDIYKPASGVILGRLYDLRARGEDITAYSLSSLQQLANNGFEMPWSSSGYISDDGADGYILMAAGNRLYRVGKGLLP